MLPINCDVVGILIKRHASPFVNDTSNYISVPLKWDELNN